MSMPIPDCWFFKAARGDEAAYKQLMDAVKVNMMYGHYSQSHCRCSSPCVRPTHDELKKLYARMDIERDQYMETEEYKESMRKNALPSSEQGMSGIRKCGL